MRVDGHGRLIEDDIEHDVRRLSADAGKRHKLFARRRHFSVEIADKDFTESDDVRRLRMVEPDRLDISFEFFLSERDDFFRRVGDFVERLGCGVDAFVGRLSGKHNRQKQRIRVFPSEFRFRIGILLFKTVEYRADFPLCQQCHGLMSRRASAHRFYRFFPS